MPINQSFKTSLKSSQDVGENTPGRATILALEFRREAFPSNKQAPPENAHFVAEFLRNQKHLAVRTQTILHFKAESKLLRRLGTGNTSQENEGGVKEGEEPVF